MLKKKRRIFKISLTFFILELSNKCKDLTNKKGGIILREFFEKEYQKHEKALFLIAVSYLHTGIMGAWAAVLIDQIIRAIITYVRFSGGKWKKIEV